MPPTNLGARRVRVKITVDEKTSDYGWDTLQEQELAFMMPIPFDVIGRNVTRMIDATMAIQADIDKAARSPDPVVVDA